MRRLAAAAAACACLALSGCGSEVKSEFPVGIGTGPNSLKASPCACLELPNAARDARPTPPEA